MSLKLALSSAAVFALPHFQVEFCIDIDVSNIGVGALLQQKGHPISYFSKALGIKHQSLLIYKKKMLATLLAVKIWHAYLVGRHFCIRTNHQSLKFLSDQWAITSFQQRWVAKMLGYDFQVLYRKGSTNAVADGLSRQHPTEGQCWQLGSTSIIWDLLHRVQNSWQRNQKLKKLCETLQQQPSSHPKYT